MFKKSSRSCQPKILRRRSEASAHCPAHPASSLGLCLPVGRVFQDGASEVPKGRQIIAQRLSAGISVRSTLSPAGTTESVGTFRHASFAQLGPIRTTFRTHG